MSKLSDPWTPRQQRHLAYISEFSTDIQHISGKTNVLADCLSQAHISGVFILSIYYAQMANAQLEDEIANQLGVTLHREQHHNYHPQSNGLIKSLHRTLKAALKARLLGPNGVDELPWVLLGLGTTPKPNLGSSSAEQVYGHPLTVPGLFIDPTFRSHSNVNDHVDMTIRRFSPVPTSNHRWHPQSAASIPPSIQNAKLVFIRRDAHRGPLQRPYDGPFQLLPGLKHFVFQIGNNEETVSVDRLKPAHTGPAEPSNGLFERFHRTLKATLKARLQGPNWADELPWVLLGLRTATKEDFGTSAAELVYRTPLSVSGEFIDPTPKPLHACAPNDLFSTCVRYLSPLPTSHHGLPSSSSVPQALRDAQFVFIRHDGHRGPLRRTYDGPFRVVASGDKTFRIMVGSREEVVSTDRLKAAHVDLTGPVTVAQPPRRGRSPLQQAEPAAEDKTLESAPPRQQPCLTRSGRLCTCLLDTLQLGCLFDHSHFPSEWELQPFNGSFATRVKFFGKYYSHMRCLRLTKTIGSLSPIIFTKSGSFQTS
ncbi:LOW QUALITY PROTEIN: Pol polyprotein [Elysia marginata]|uniref:Pol polyprotein n=1 Tax=Elysia marginata TaxID=1093978 RepID=A0AAV4GHN9_9GAST|nr:LOW QUALITY PROTEIN: Pol polyprotein [Elysia marginata]